MFILTCRKKIFDDNVFYFGRAVHRKSSTQYFIDYTTYIDYNK